jgi:hypothetical protein
MTRITGMGEAFVGFDGGDFTSIGQIGGLDGVQCVQLKAGDYVIPADAVKKFTAGRLNVSGTFTGTFAGAPGCYFGWEDTGPDEDGWEPRTNWDRR